MCGPKPLGSSENNHKRTTNLPLTDEPKGRIRSYYGFINAAGNKVVNRDLIEEAYDLEEMLANVRGRGRVKYVWIPRKDNKDADGAVNDVLDQM